MFRPPSSTFDSAIRSRYFPGGPTPEGLESDMMFKSLSGETDQLRARRESEGEMMTDTRYSVLLLRSHIEKVKTYSTDAPTFPETWPDLLYRYRMTPPESPRERDGANHSTDNVMAIDINQRDQGRGDEEGDKP